LKIKLSHKHGLILLRAAKWRVDRERAITIAILAGLFGGLVGGPIASLADYYALAGKRFWLF
jgi:hypothetical protein